MPTGILTPAHVHPDAIYQDGQARLLLGLTGMTYGLPIDVEYHWPRRRRAALFQKRMVNRVS